MRRLSNLTHCTIIVEGMPLTAVRNDLDAVIGDARDAAAGWDAITRVADAFDYDTERINSHLILLRKRYSDENDLPCVTFDEIQHSLSAILKLNNTYFDGDGYLTGDQNAEKLYRSLTDEQLKRAADGIPVADLPDEQKSLAKSVAGFYMIAAKVVLLSQALNRLMYLKSPQTTFQWLALTKLNAEAFGFREPINARGFLVDCPLNNGFRLFTGGFAPIFHSGPAMLADGAISLAGTADSDPTTPQEIDKHLASGMLANRLPSTQTLNELVQAWSAGKLGSGEPDGVTGATEAMQADVAAGLGEKPVCLFGGAYSRAEQQIRAVSNLYDLELLVTKQGEYHLVMPILSPPKSSVDYSHEIGRLIPPPLLQQYTGLMTSSAKALAKKEAGQAVAASAQSPTPLPGNGYTATMQRKIISESFANYGGYYPAVRRLLVLAKPLVPTRTSPPVQLTDANPEVLRLLALIFYASDGCRKEVADLIDQPLPECLIHPDALAIKVKLSKDGMRASWGFGSLDANGAFHREGGVIASFPPSGGKN